MKVISISMPWKRKSLCSKVKIKVIVTSNLCRFSSKIYSFMTKNVYINNKLQAVTYRRNQMPPTRGMAPHISPHRRANPCLIQCNTSPSWSCDKECIQSVYISFLANTCSAQASKFRVCSKMKIVLLSI